MPRLVIHLLSQSQNKCDIIQGNMSDIGTIKIQVKKSKKYVVLLCCKYQNGGYQNKMWHDSRKWVNYRFWDTAGEKDLKILCFIFF